VKKLPAHLPESLRRRISSLDARSIDELYGLEPVYEPSAPAAGRFMHEEFICVQCPYCGERFETRIDLTSDDSGYVEDCQVCCRPIEFGIEREDGGALVGVKVQRMD
jgi:cysteine-rich CPXCG protein